MPANDGDQATESSDPWVLIDTPMGETWSGRTRYAAAMSLYAAGEMNAETLEVYRICSRLDDENPIEVLRRWNTGADWIARFLERSSKG